VELERRWWNCDRIYDSERYHFRGGQKRFAITDRILDVWLPTVDIKQCSPGTFRNKWEKLRQSDGRLGHNICRTIMDKYPRFSFRLSPAILRKVDMLARLRNGTRGQVVREAIEFYFSVRTKITEQSEPPSSR
jgi:hypothetical protein